MAFPPNSQNALGRAHERKILLKRIFYTDRDVYRLGKFLELKWFERFDTKFTKDVYAYFADDERKEAVDLIVNVPIDTTFVEAVNNVFNERERYVDIDRFVGRYYYFDKRSGFKIENRTDQLVQETSNALKDTQGRGFYFLKAVIDLNREGKWDRAYGGAAWADILAKARELGGPYPSPRDLGILKSYRIYYRTGSRRYPTHTVPEEMIPTIQKVLMIWKNKKEPEPKEVEAIKVIIKKLLDEVSKLQFKASESLLSRATKLNKLLTFLYSANRPLTIEEIKESTKDLGIDQWWKNSKLERELIESGLLIEERNAQGVATYRLSNIAKVSKSLLEMPS